MNKTGSASVVGMLAGQKAFVRPQRCETCKWMAQENGGYFCHEAPPVAIPVQDSGGGIRTFASFPPVTAHSFCGRWRTRIEGVQ